MHQRGPKPGSFLRLSVAVTLARHSTAIQIPHVSELICANLMGPVRYFLGTSRGVGDLSPIIILKSGWPSLNSRRKNHAAKTATTHRNRECNCRLLSVTIAPP